MKRYLVHVTNKIMIIAVLVLIISPNTTEATLRFEDGAKTQPPNEYGIQGFFDSDHQYLLDGENIIYKDNKHNISVGGTTYAKQGVQSIGLSIYIQKWDGTSWMNIDSGKSYSTNNQNRFDKTVQYDVEPGYYYRIKTIHWVSNEGVYESGELISDYILLD